MNSDVFLISHKQTAATIGNIEIPAADTYQYKRFILSFDTSVTTSYRVNVYPTDGFIDGSSSILVSASGNQEYINDGGNWLKIK